MYIRVSHLTNLKFIQSCVWLKPHMTKDMRWGCIKIVSFNATCVTPRVSYCQYNGMIELLE